MSIKAVNFLQPVPTLQADATLNQANPVSGTEYAVLATTRNVRVRSITNYVTWTVQPSPLENHATVDGVAITYAVTNPVTATYYFAATIAYAAANSQSLSTTAFPSYMAFLLEGRSVAVTAEITGGTVQSMVSRVKYGKW